MKKNSNLAKLNNTANRINNNVKKVVENELLINVVRVALILYASFVVPMMSQKQLNLANNQIVRLVVLALVVYLAFMDIVTASLLLVSFLVTLHHSKNGNGNNGGNNKPINDVEGQNIMDAVNNVLNKQVENYESLPPAENSLESQVVNNNLVNNNNMLSADNGNEVNGKNDNKLANELENDYVNAFENEKKSNNDPTGYDPESVVSVVNNNGKNNNNINTTENNSNNNVMTAPVESNNKVMSDEDLTNLNMNQPASMTLTDGILRAQGAENNVNDPMGLTTGQNLYDASENAVPNSNILDQVKSVKNQLSAQGMDYPFGAGAKRYEGYHYDDAHISHAMLRNEQTSSN